MLAGTWVVLTRKMIHGACTAEVCLARAPEKVGAWQSMAWRGMVDVCEGTLQVMSVVDAWYRWPQAGASQAWPWH